MGREPCPLPSALSFALLCHNPPAETTSTLCPCSFQHVIRGNRPIKTEMAHQLYVLQVLTFNLLEERMMTKMDPNDQVGSQWYGLPGWRRVPCDAARCARCLECLLGAGSRASLCLQEAVLSALCLAAIPSICVLCDASSG